MALAAVCLYTCYVHRLRLRVFAVHIFRAVAVVVAVVLGWCMGTFGPFFYPPVCCPLLLLPVVDCCCLFGPTRPGATLGRTLFWQWYNQSYNTVLDVAALTLLLLACRQSVGTILT